MGILFFHKLFVNAQTTPATRTEMQAAIPWSTKLSNPPTHPKKWTPTPPRGGGVPAFSPKSGKYQTNPPTHPQTHPLSNGLVSGYNGRMVVGLGLVQCTHTAQNLLPHLLDPSLEALYITGLLWNNNLCACVLWNGHLTP